MRKTNHLLPRLAIFTIGLLVMSLGIDLMIISDFGASPWDVLHVGLFYQFGLSIGTWSIIVGLFILGSSALMMKEWPQFGAYLNMILIGIFIDMYMLLPFLTEPGSWIGKTIMFFIGMIIYAYGMGIYLSAQLGAGPRDSFMLAMQVKTGWKVANVRRFMEVAVLITGWLLGGPVFVGTIVFSVAAGTFIGLALPQCKKLTDTFLKNEKLKNLFNRNEIERGAS
ncbi:YczE/YyaS/YitT family protein [Lederbergia citrea]|uniref:YitT family protein n=1 Tax=Lederbergia citrea TaxID=2833581 RepID=A0A942UP86_9BACI|nr:YitT family protein [Lederbergia citrea]MBS4176236.1 YitT family protein [Lederbergia citrea]MBS4202796.1 YitT family protein [Lederbergia citrea]MBS4222536.1 YitT family protein [Lederbergia citrea]